MGNARMSTKYKPILEQDLPRRVKNAVEGAIAPHDTSRIAGLSIEVPFKAVIEWEEKPTLPMNPHWTKITFYGNTRFQRGHAVYEGIYGKWDVDLVGFRGPIPQSKWETTPCNRTYGTPYCIQPSDEWRETIEQKRERIRKWIAEGIL